MASKHSTSKTTSIATELSQFMDETMTDPNDDVGDCVENETDNPAGMIYFGIKRGGLFYAVQVNPETEQPEGMDALTTADADATG